MKAKRKLTDSQKALRGLAVAMLVGLLSVIVYAAHAGGSKGFLAIASVGVLLAGASALVGGALGFLFGIPRTLQQEGGGSGPEANPTGKEAASPARRIDYRANTNLEQISDWLTKILVGVGLTQIAEIREGLASMMAFAAQGLGPKGSAEVFASALLSYSAVLGFLFGYLWTRLFLAGALRVADLAAIGVLAEKVKTTERQLDEFKKQAELDAAAHLLASQQLNPSQDLPQVTQEQLNAAVAAASRPSKVNLFNLAWQVRADNWRDASTKPKMERTIPLFRALISSDVDNDHMYHGQLGFALKDMLQPQWAEAEKELTTAIEFRGSALQHGWLFYEFNRAICRIMGDQAYIQDLPSSADRRSQILEDLRLAVRSKDIDRIARSDSAIQKWLALNNVTRKELSGA